MNLFRKIFGASDSMEELKAEVSEALDGLELLPAGVTRGRVEAALPGTAELEPLLELEAPPVTIEQDYLDEPDRQRDYEPNPVVEIAARFTASRPFSCKTVEDALYGELHDRALRPTMHVKTQDGHTTFLSTSDAPEAGIELIAAWLPDPAEGMTVEAVAAAHAQLAAGLQVLPFGFSADEFDMNDAVRKFRMVRSILELAPNELEVVAYRDDGQEFDGRTVWNLLHAMGFTWGDMDCFQWQDPTGQTDYLIWVTTDDGELGYALPELIAAGNQDFQEVRFSITLPRTPSPSHVLEQLLRAAGKFQAETGCDLAALVDGEVVPGKAALRSAAASLEDAVQHLGLRPGESAITLLR